MSCCPPAPEIVDGSAGDADVPSQDSKILPGESVECYMKRAENPSGMKDDLQEPIPDKIDNTSIPVGADASINVTFRLTNNSAAPSGLKWFITGTLPVGISFNETTGVLSGTVGAADHGKSFSLLVTAAKNSPSSAPATGSADFIDSRTFNFSPAPASKEDIQFVHPLPGQPISSPFGPRQHPVHKTQAPHKGVDFNTPGSTLSDVVAAADGEVTYVGTQGAAGNMIKIDHRNSSGVMLCQTVYMHLSQFYVSVGQKVAAGQKIAKEGNTGVGTGPHLHFECRIIKNGTTTWVDPVPYIRGQVKYQAGVAPGAAPGQEVTVATPGATISQSGAAAQAGGCAPFGPSYPPDPEAPPPAPLPPPGDVFELAWYFTMKYEVGPHWMTTPQFSPGDPDLDQGKKETTLQRKQVGYKNYAGFPGGETKFGIAQGPNPNIAVGPIEYAPAKQVGYDNYWRKGSNPPSSLASTKPKTAVMLFDMIYLHGGGNVRGAILPKANIGSLDDVASCNALHAAQMDFINAIVRANPSRERYKNGWVNRSKALLAYALALP